ncbi:MAG: WYL domain-containing protein [Chloroflexi bacterium]|nr:WYL domain-containing protein [Chloroflexota bacterium]
MSQLAFLIQDVFTLLAFLSANAIHPIGSRYLPPSALAKLNLLLVVPDDLNLKRPHNADGRWRAGVRVHTSERYAERIRFIHYLAESAHLVARTNTLLKPTPRVAVWLNASPAQRAQVLFRPAFPIQPTQEDAERWRAFGLPGKHLLSPLSALGQLIAILAQVPNGERITCKALLKLLALPSDDDGVPEDQPVQILGAWLELLRWFEIVTSGQGETTQVTKPGGAIIGQTDPKRVETNHKTQPLAWSKSRGTTLPNLIAPLEADFAILFELGDYATHLATLREASAHQTRRLYQLDAARVRCAMDHGKTITQVQSFLERATDDALPRIVTDWLDQISLDYGCVTVRSVTLLEVRDPNLLVELTRRKSIRQCLRRTLSSRAVVVQPSQLNALARRLERHGYPPRLEMLDHPAAQAPGHPLAQFDQPTLAHLYVSTRLAHQFSDRIPTSYRPPASILLDLEHQLTAHDRAIAEELIREGIQATTDRRPPTAEISPLDFSAHGELQSTLQLIERALTDQALLEIVYHSPYNDETTTRLVEPLRLEYRDQIPYLIAYCHRAGDERTFRVARIQQLALASTHRARQRASRRN